MERIEELLDLVGAGFVDFASAMLLQSTVLAILLLAIDRLLRKRVRAVVRYWIWMLLPLKLLLPPTLALPTGLAYWVGGDFLTPGISGLGDGGEGETRAGREATALDPALATRAGATMGIAGAEVSDAEVGLAPLASAGASDGVAAAPSAVPLGEEGGAAAAGLSALAPSGGPLAGAPAGSRAEGAAERGVSSRGAIFLLWAAVGLAMLLLWAQRILSVRRLVAGSMKPAPELAGLLAECRARIGVRTAVDLRISRRVAAPAVCGLLRPVILLPKGLAARLGRSALAPVLLHELAHVKRGDLAVSALQTILQIVYFYNPLLWVANATIRRAREQAVDEMVLVALGREAEAYPDVLLRIARLSFARPAFALRLTGVAESPRALTARIEHILERPLPKSARLGAAGLVALLVGGALLLPMAEAQREPGPQPLEAAAGGSSPEKAPAEEPAVEEPSPEGAAPDEPAAPALSRPERFVEGQRVVLLAQYEPSEWSREYLVLIS